MKKTNPAEFSVAASEIRKQLEHEIRMELEYYFTEQNPQLDDDNSTGSIPIDTLLHLARLKALNVTKNELLNAISDSEKLIINGDGTGIKRKADNSLEDLEPAIQKKVKLDNGESNAVENEKIFEEKLFKITMAPADKKLRASQVITELEKNFKVKIPYLRLQGREGYFALEANSLTEKLKAKLAHADLEINGVTMKIQECWDSDLDTFFMKHGKHLDSFLERKGHRRKLRSSKDEVDLIFYNKKYTNVAPLEYLFQSILSKTENDQVINSADHQLVKELITYHDNFDELVKDLDYFTTGHHPTDKITRCFYAVKKDGSRLPFTFTECYANLLDLFEEARKDIELP